ncbi:MAG TPA: ABC transporter ATP-binding protein, partial [Solirubrobacterales bacterium]|nr:ABC transporter ATP-binding protein [Solirubrobacterales bacterium]
LGSNGAGKSTTLRAVSGLLRPSGGQILLEGRPLAGLPAHRVVAQGVIHCPEGRQVFPRMSVRENLLLGAHRRPDRQEIAERLERVHGLFPILGERAAQLAGTLSGGEQQMLAIARALMGGPRLLLLDEPSLGLAPRIIEGILGAVAAINAAGTTILMVEQNATKALAIAHRAYVLQVGRVVAEGTGRELLTDGRIQRAYLGH